MNCGRVRRKRTADVKNCQHLTFLVRPIQLAHSLHRHCKKKKKSERNGRRNSQACKESGHVPLKCFSAIPRFRHFHLFFRPWSPLSGLRALWGDSPFIGGASCQLQPTDLGSRRTFKVFVVWSWAVVSASPTPVQPFACPRAQQLVFFLRFFKETIPPVCLPRNYFEIHRGYPVLVSKQWGLECEIWLYPRRDLNPRQPTLTIADRRITVAPPDSIMRGMGVGVEKREKGEKRERNSRKAKLKLLSRVHLYFAWK